MLAFVIQLGSSCPPLVKPPPHLSQREERSPHCLGEGIKGQTDEVRIMPRLLPIISQWVQDRLFPNLPVGVEKDQGTWPLSGDFCVSSRRASKPRRRSRPLGPNPDCRRSRARRRRCRRKVMILAIPQSQGTTLPKVLYGGGSFSSSSQ